MLPLQWLLASALAATANAVSLDSPRALRFARALGYDHRLRVCNAYPSETPMEVYRGDHKLTRDQPLAYASCRDFGVQFQAGDMFDFKLGNANAGMFSISDLPDNDALLLLVVYRHDTRSTAVAFQSHVFANLANSQIAVIDTYKGAAKAKFSICDDDKMAHYFKRPATKEDLRMNSVVAVNAGVYNVSLLSDLGAVVNTKDVVAASRQSYVMLRVGLETDSDAYPPQMVFFPESKVQDLPEEVQNQVHQAYAPPKPSGAMQSASSLFLVLVSTFLFAALP